MNILAIGDVVGSAGCKFLRSHLPSLKKLRHIDPGHRQRGKFRDGNGITPASAQYLFDSGVDVITGGNHSFRRREIYDRYDEEETLLRPANFPPGAPGKGACIVDRGRIQIGVINLMGVVYLENLDCPSPRRIACWRGCRPSPCWISTPKPPRKRGPRAGIWTGGFPRCSAPTRMVQTADETILPGGTGFHHRSGYDRPHRFRAGCKNRSW